MSNVDILCKVKHSVILYGESYKDYNSTKRDEIPAIELFGNNSKYANTLQFYDNFIVKDYDDKYVRNARKILDFIDKMNFSNKLAKANKKALSNLLSNEDFKKISGEKFLKPARKVFFGLIKLGPSYSDNSLKYEFNKRYYDKNYYPKLRRTYAGWYLKSEVYDIEIQYKD